MEQPNQEECIVCGKKAHNLYFCKLHDPSREMPEDKGVWEISGEIHKEIKKCSENRLKQARGHKTKEDKPK